MILSVIPVYKFKCIIRKKCGRWGCSVNRWKVNNCEQKETYLYWIIWKTEGSSTVIGTQVPPKAACLFASEGEKGERRKKGFSQKNFFYWRGWIRVTHWCHQREVRAFQNKMDRVSLSQVMYKGLWAAAIWVNQPAQKQESRTGVNTTSQGSQVRGILPPRSSTPSLFGKLVIQLK